MSVVRVEIILYLCMVYTAHHSNDLLFGRRALSGLERNLFPGFGRFRLKKQNPNVQNPRKKQEELVLYNAMPNWYAEL